MDYVSKIVKLARSQQQVYDLFSDFRQLSAFIPKDKVEDFEAGETECSFTVKPVGRVGLLIENKEPAKMIKYAAHGKVPFPFNLWVQLIEVAPYDTRLRLTLRAELNFVMRNMVGKKLQKGLDEMAGQIAAAFTN